MLGGKSTISIKLGQHTVDTAKSEKHLGVLLSTSLGCEVEFMKKRILSCKTICNGIRSLGSHRVPISPVVAAKLYRTICIPKLCYGAEVMDIGSESLDLMESYQSTCAKQFIGVPIQCSSPGSVGTMGWQSIEATIDILRMLFLWKILLLDTTNIYKRAAICRFFQIVYKGYGKGPMNNIIDTFTKHGLFDVLYESIENGEYMNYQEFKRCAINKVNNVDIKRWKVTCSLYKSLTLLNYRNINKYFPNGWLVLAHKNPLVISKVRCIINILLNTYRLGENVCMLYHGCNYDTAQHILFECDVGHDERDKMWTSIVLECPTRLAIELSDMSNSSKIKFILNAMNCDYIDEWYELYMSMCNYVHTVYMSYYNVMLQLKAASENHT